jgi:hypothetical protein
MKDFSDEYFTDSSRRSLGILSLERARRHEAYLAPEREKLERIIHRKLALPGFRPHPRLASVLEQTGRHQTLIERQFMVMWRIAHLAAADALLGVFEPATARERALGLPVLQGGPDEIPGATAS